MNGKMMAGIGLVVGIVAIAFLSTPIQAYVNGNDEMLQAQTQERLKSQDCHCSMLQIQEQERLGAQHRDCSCNCTQTQNRNRQLTGECAANETCIQTMKMKQFRNQHRERTLSQGG
jgi:hypothetical protein